MGRAEIPGQMTMELIMQEHIPIENKVDIKYVQAHVLTIGRASIGNIMRVFRVSSNEAAEYVSKLQTAGIIDTDGKVDRKKGDNRTWKSI